MNNSFDESYFVDGGTLGADTPSYVHRPADNELFQALLRGEYCYILTPRQMGKSSLMTRTSQQLNERNIKNAVVDIQGMAARTASEFYASLLSRIRRGLKLSVDIDEWMTKKRSVGLAQMFSDFIQDVVLTEIAELVVIFLDEVDWMIKVDFRDDFFASIRSMYNARAQYPEFNRISFVLSGVASPADLISEPTRTPFNIGRAVPLQEFSLEDATPLQEGLEQVYPGEGIRILERIFYWTNGHPYLTQKICKTIAERGNAAWSNDEIDDLVHHLFLSDESRKETNLKFIQTGILDNEQSAQMLKLYKRVQRNRVKENAQSIIQNQLMLSGLLTSRGEYLEVRNRIYRTVFNDAWVNRNTPRNWQRYAIVALGATVVLLLSTFIYNRTLRGSLGQSEIDFRNTPIPEERISILAKMYRLEDQLSDIGSDSSATELFYSLQRQDQLNVFAVSSVSLEDADLQHDLVTVISNLYRTVAYVHPDNDNTKLLEAMNVALGNIKDNAASDNLRTEISKWISARQEYINQNYDTALSMYNDAIGPTPKNPATLYERALVYVALANDQNPKQGSGQDASENYANALRDLDTTLGLASESRKRSATSASPSAMDSVETATIQVLGNPDATLVFGPSTPEILPTATATPGIDQFEAKFSTLNQIVSAIEALIINNSGLQMALQPNGDVTYTNLQSNGLVKQYPALVTSTVPSAACDGAQFIADVTIPDGTILAPGASFTKTWRIKNIGQCTWTTSYQLVFFSGTQMSGPSSAAFPNNVAVGQTVDISVEMTAPSAAGSYRGFWMVKNADGALFGIGLQANRPWWVDIRVPDPTITPGGPTTTPGGPTLTPSPLTVVRGSAYDFTANADSAAWYSGAGELSFPGTDGDDKGFVLVVKNPNYESGMVGSNPGLLTFPQNIENGYIQGFFPPFKIQRGDRFQSTISCESGATSCYVAYRLDYQTGTDPIRTLWGPFLQRFEGLTYNVDVDLSLLAGKDVKFILTILAAGTATEDRALWGSPVIVRSEGNSSLPTPTPR